jgi:hypothetical protein
MSLSRWAALFCLVGLSACAHRLGDWSALTQRFQMNGGALAGDRVRGSDCAFFVFDEPNLEAATDRALEGVAKSQMLLDVAVYYRDYLLVECIEIRGTLAAVKKVRIVDDEVAYETNKL